MKLDNYCEELLALAVERLDLDVLHRTRAVLGGGTVLAARWHHRLSTDIDLFASVSNWLAVRTQIREKLEGYTNINVSSHSTVIVCQLDDGREFSFGGSDSITERAISQETEKITGLATHTTTEIIARKIRARMVDTQQYLVRDAYDTVCCAKHDPQALQRALSCFDQQERAALDFDRGQLNIQINTSKPLEQPIYTELAKPTVLREALFDTLAGKSYETQAQLYE